MKMRFLQFCPLNAPMCHMHFNVPHMCTDAYVRKYHCLSVSSVYPTQPQTTPPSFHHLKLPPPPFTTLTQITPLTTLTQITPLTTQRQITLLTTQPQITPLSQPNLNYPPLQPNLKPPFSPPNFKSLPPSTTSSSNHPTQTHEPQKITFTRLPL